MKKFYCLLIFILIFNSAFSQETNLTFLNLPISGNVIEFSKKLQTKGFKLIKQDQLMLTGKFSGEDCVIILCETKKTKTIWKVVVLLEKEDRWFYLKEKFLLYEERLSKKYGEPTTKYHFFSSPYYEGDGYEMLAINENACNYIAFWNNFNGIISTEINKFKLIQISYEDAIGVKLMKSELEEQANKDL